ncbi:MAG: thiamine-phosphate kinase [Desulfovibrio sp.]|jgi:thiamine-monophosphate kinase|nr:thiamine-phosphate kinase [Desulfovibrio sp.]
MSPLLSEDAILARIARHFPETHPGLAVGRGDDAALLKRGTPLAVSTDIFLEDVHFRDAYFTPEDVGHKALAVNLSDMAAAGAVPVAFTMCLGLGTDVDADWLDRFLQRMAVLAKTFDVALAGGDLSRSQRTMIAITIFGAQEEEFLPRGGAAPGDCIFCVGPLGLARVGLDVLETGGRKEMESWPDACAAHLRPIPLVADGLAIARQPRPLTLMDISDGIVRDLPRLLAAGGRSDLGAELLLPRERLHPEVMRHAAGKGLDPVEQALLGGEDYGLLGTCKPAALASLLAAVPWAFLFGTVTGDGKIFCNGRSLAALRGFDHFEAGT